MRGQRKAFFLITWLLLVWGGIFTGGVFFLGALLFVFALICFFGFGFSHFSERRPFSCNFTGFGLFPLLSLQMFWVIVLSFCDFYFIFPFFLFVFLLLCLFFFFEIIFRLVYLCSSFFVPCNLSFFLFLYLSFISHFFMFFVSCFLVLSWIFQINSSNLPFFNLNSSCFDFVSCHCFFALVVFDKPLFCPSYGLQQSVFKPLFSKCVKFFGACEKTRLLLWFQGN